MTSDPGVIVDQAVSTKLFFPYSFFLGIQFYKLKQSAIFTFFFPKLGMFKILV